MGNLWIMALVVSLQNSGEKSVQTSVCPEGESLGPALGFSGNGLNFAHHQYTHYGRKQNFYHD
jgi:hypothetical protein